jgi:serine/threonine-protein kinase HipA
VQDERAVTKGEVLAMTLAKAAGLDVAAARIVNSDGLSVALIRRFDRTPDGRRLMYVSAATLLGVESAGAQEHSYCEIVDALRVNGAAAQAGTLSNTRSARRHKSVPPDWRKCRSSNRV